MRILPEADRLEMLETLQKSSSDVERQLATLPFRIETPSQVCSVSDSVQYCSCQQLLLLAITSETLAQIAIHLLGVSGAVMSRHAHEYVDERSGPRLGYHADSSQSWSRPPDVRD